MIINGRGQKGAWSCMCPGCLTPKLDNYEGYLYTHCEAQS